MRVGLGEHERDAAQRPRRARPGRRRSRRRRARRRRRGGAGCRAAAPSAAPALHDRARGLQRVRARDALDVERVELVAGRRHELGLGALAARRSRPRRPQPAARRRPRSPARRGPPSRRPRSRSSAARSRRRRPRPDRAQMSPSRRSATFSSSPIAHSSTISERRARRDERQRHAGERREAEDGVDVEQRLAQDQAGEAGGEQLGVDALRAFGRSAAPRTRSCRRGTAAPQIPARPELLADDGEDEVGVGLGQVEDLLHRLAGPERRTARRSRSRSGPGRPGSPTPTASAHGFRNAVRRARRYGLEDREQSTRNAPTPATSPSWRSGRPAATSIAASVKQITSAVPRSGCASDQQHRARRRRRGSARRRVRRLRAIFGRAAITAAACRTSASFMISVGWNCSGPAPSQRRAPLILHADARAAARAASSTKRDQQQDRRVAADALEPVAREHVHRRRGRSRRRSRYLTR